MKRFRNAFLALLGFVLLLCLFPAFAAADESGECGDDLYWFLDESTGLLTITGSGNMQDYSFSTSTPWIKRKIISVSLPTGLTSVGKHAFDDCENLTSIVIPDSVTSIGDYAFSNCKSLTSVTIGNSVKKIGMSSFQDCIGLTSIIIPDSVTSIGGSAFARTRLKSLTMPCSASSGRIAFQNCSIISTVHLTKGTGIWSLTQGSDPWYNTPWSDSKDAIRTVYLDEGITKIGRNAFEKCSGITSVTIPSSATSIEAYAFYYCTGLTSITIPRGVTSIGQDAFAGSGLVSVTMPTSITNIDGYAFNSTNIKDVYYQGTKDQRNKIAINNNNQGLLNATWHYSRGPSTAYTPTDGTVKTVKVQAKKSVKLQAPKIKKAQYQWYQRANKNAAWQSLGKKGSKQKLSAKVTRALDGYQYRCQVKTATGISFTDIYELYVYEQLKIKKQPKWSKASTPGSRVTLSITATGADSYQWLVRPNGSAAWQPIEGANGTSYTVEVQAGMAGYQFACRVTGRQGTVTSKPAKVKMAKVK